MVINYFKIHITSNQSYPGLKDWKVIIVAYGLLA